MYEFYEVRTVGTRRRGRYVLLLVALLVVAALAAVLLFVTRAPGRPISTADGVKRVSGVEGNNLVTYDGKKWKPQFWNGINMGATLAGHAPGELAPTKEDYLRWFPKMKAMNVDVLRVYTILSPQFYEALNQFNAGRKDPLWLVQGVWSPEEELIGKDEEGRDAYDPKITGGFEGEIRDAVRVVHGDADIPPRRGHASGHFDADVSQYMLGWMLGTEWYPYAVKVTDDAHPNQKPYSGKYFRAKKGATAFESWLASMLDVMAKEEMKYGWQHPASFTNWLTTDPLSHPEEAFPQEDLVSVDPTHLGPTSAWKAGYYAAFHVYPYYPDFLRFEKKYQDYKTPDGRTDPYSGYLNELRRYVKDMPLVVAEFGVPSSRGMAHYGPLGRNQGHHTEKEQGSIEATLLKDMRQEGYDGGFLFAWQDEWFKFTWNTAEIDIPPDRRPMWLNRLTNEQNFGVLAESAGKMKDRIFLDGKTADWKNHPNVSKKSYPGMDLSVTHDEAYLYLLAKKKDGDWSFPKDELNVGFGTKSGGSKTADAAPGLTFPKGGIQTLLKINGRSNSKMFINSAYDYHTWTYGSQLNMILTVPNGGNVDTGKFLLWKLALSRPLTLPQSGRKIPFEEFDVGKMKPGITDPSSPKYDSLADWYAKGDVLEVRIPWTMLGYTDPSELKVWDNLYKAGKIKPVKSPGLRVYPALKKTGNTEIIPLYYTWKGWDDPKSYERKKQSYYIMQRAFENKKLDPIPKSP